MKTIKLFAVLMAVASQAACKVSAPRESTMKDSGVVSTEEPLKAWTGCYDQIQSETNAVSAEVCIHLSQLDGTVSIIDTGDMVEPVRTFKVGETQLSGESALESLRKDPRAAASLIRMGIAGVRVKRLMGVQGQNLFIRHDVYHVNFFGGQKMYASTLDLFTNQNGPQRIFEMRVFSGEEVQAMSTTSALKKNHGDQIQRFAEFTMNSPKSESRSER
jgi:hypothetical protein